jgi:broad specificity phosphatase PhoE
VSRLEWLEADAAPLQRRGETHARHYRTMRRRLYLMRHAQVRYFAGEHPREVALTELGLEQARAAHDALRGIRLDRVVTSGLRRTEQTAAIVAPGIEPERRAELREIESGSLGSIPADELERAFTHVFKGEVPEDKPFLGGETIGALLDRVLPELERLVADPDWDVALAVLHGAVNRAILSYALTGRRSFLGGFEQAPACINVIDVGDDWVVRAVNHTPYDPAHVVADRTTTMEGLWEDFRAARRAAEEPEEPEEPK